MFTLLDYPPGAVARVLAVGRAYAAGVSVAVDAAASAVHSRLPF